MSKSANKIKELISNIVTAILVGAVILSGFFIYQIMGKYEEKAAMAVEDGQRIIYVIAENKITQRDSEKIEEGNIVGINDIEDNSFVDTPRLAVIVNGIGLLEGVSNEALALPKEVAIAITPYSNNIEKWMSEAKAQGHEIFIDLPMESINYPHDDPGIYAMLAQSGKAKNVFRFKKIMELAKGFNGVVGSVDEKFTHSFSNVIGLLKEFNAQNLSFIYNERNSNADLKLDVRSMGVPYINKFIVIDEVLTKHAIEAKLEHVKDLIMNSRKTTLIVARPYPVTIKTLSKWLAESTEEGLKLVPVSDITKK